MSARAESITTLLRRAGAVDPDGAVAVIGQIEGLCGVTLEDVPRAVSYLANPDAGLAAMLRLAESARDSGHLDDVRALANSGGGARLGVLLGGSSALADFLIRHPELIADFRGWDTGTGFAEADVRAELLAAVGADPADAAPVATLTGLDAVNAMRVAYRRALVRIAAEDLFAKTPAVLYPAVAAALADAAGAALEAGLAIARAEEPDHATTRLAIIGMGKCGARELNYVSDVDVIFVAEPAPGVEDTDSLRVATKLANAAARACDKTATEPALWPVDANLRPEGKDGALVRGVESHRAYYERWAQTWEFQALLKARVIAGDAEVGAAYLDAVSPFVWVAAEREGFVEAAQKMRRRVEDNVPAGESERQLKLGPGGLRDVEFTVQLLQLVHGRADASIRSSTTLEALDSLRRGGYVGRDQAARMDESYRQLRVWEHRLQLEKLRRTHLMPVAPEALRTLARASGYATADGMVKAWQDIKRDVRSMHLEMFYRPMLPAIARLSAGEASLDGAAARARLAAVGFTDPEGAQRHLVALTDGVSRRAAIQRQLLPAMIGWFAGGADPDAGLLAFRQLSEQLEDAQWFLKLLRDSRTAAERLARLLATSGYVADALLASAESITWLDSDDDLMPRSAERLQNEADAILTRSDDAEQCITALRGLRRRELARTAAADVLGLCDSVEAAATVTTVADVVIAGALRVALVEVAREHGLESLPLAMAVVAMGRLGGSEMGYASDADVMFVYEPRGEQREDGDTHGYAQQVAAMVRMLLQRGGTQPALEIDADLRPEGKNGPLARSLESYAEYYQRWSDPWEVQALLRARVCAGDPELAASFTALIDTVRYPVELSPAALKQMRTLKARMESERLPRGTDPRRHVKLGPGGLSDVEWTVQLLQLRHARDHAALRTTVTLVALEAATQAGLVDEQDAAALRAAWLLASEIRGAVVLRGKDKRHVNVLPADARELRVLAEIMGAGHTGAELEERYARAARRARSVAEKVFFGW